MKNVVFYSFLMACLLMTFHGFTQENKDCETAYPLVGESPYYFNNGPGTGMVDSAAMDICLVFEAQSRWFSFTVLEAGILTFVITPDSFMHDLDFAVFKFPPTNNCDDLELIRCMAAGDYDSLSVCLGPTGLAYGELDVEETTGCVDGQNNFLVPMEVEAGDRYVLLINDYAMSGWYYTLSFGGTAVLDGIVLSTESQEEHAIEPFQLSPTQTSDMVWLELLDNTWVDANVTIFNSIGQAVHLEASIGQGRYAIDMSDKPVGAYWAVLRKGKRMATKQFVLYR